LKVREKFSRSPLKNRALISAVGKELLQKWIQAEQGRENKQAAIPILNIGWMHHGMQQQT
jgi:hypothetical protein